MFQYETVFFKPQSKLRIKSQYFPVEIMQLCINSLLDSVERFVWSVACQGSTRLKAALCSRKPKINQHQTSLEYYKSRTRIGPTFSRTRPLNCGIVAVQNCQNMTKYQRMKQ